VRINERKHRGVADNKKMAYLVDLKTIAISEWLQSSFSYVAACNYCGRLWSRGCRFDSRWVKQFVFQEL